jgi:REP element-mobilizing transposase RayT
MEYRSNRNIGFSCKYHAVFCAKYRRPVLVNGVDRRLKQIVAEVVEEAHGILIEVEVTPDHVHLLTDVDPQVLFLEATIGSRIITRVVAAWRVRFEFSVVDRTILQEAYGDE